MVGSNLHIRVYYTSSYHQKVPETVPDLELKAEFGLAKPEPYQLPARHELWTEKALAAFELSNTEPPKVLSAVRCPLSIEIPVFLLYSNDEVPVDELLE